MPVSPVDKMIAIYCFMLVFTYSRPVIIMKRIFFNVW